MSDWDSVLEGLARDAESALWPEGSKNWQADRSEEHTSELQSRLHLVCRLLLEKKKKNNKRTGSSQTPPTEITNGRDMLLRRQPNARQYSRQIISVQHYVPQRRVHALR